MRSRPLADGLISFSLLVGSIVSRERRARPPRAAANHSRPLNVTDKNARGRSPLVISGSYLPTGATDQLLTSATDPLLTAATDKRYRSATDQRY